MATPKWEETKSVATSVPTWETTTEVGARPAPSRIEALGRGGRMGATLGFADELSGGAGAIEDLLIKKAYGLKGEPSFGESYRRERDIEREKEQAARAEHPGTYITGEIAGSLAPTLIPGVAPARGARLATSVAKMAGLGATAAAGASQADVTKGEMGEFTKDVGKGAAVGAAAGATIPAIRGVGKLIKKGVKKTAKGITAYLTEVPMEAIEEKLKRPGAIRAAKTVTEIADEMPDMLDTFDDMIRQGDNKAWATLNRSAFLNDGAIPKEDVLKIVTGASKSMGAAIGKQDIAAKRALGNLARDLQSQKPTISQGRLKDIIQKLDRNINWDDPGASVMNNKLKGIRVAFDGILKKSNPKYAEAMKPISEMIQTRDKMLKAFSIKKTPGTGYEMSDTTVSKVKAGHKEAKAATQKLYNDIQKYIKVPVKQDIKDAYIKSLFENADKTSGLKQAIVTGINPYGSKGEMAQKMIEFSQRHPLMFKALQAPGRAAVSGIKYGTTPSTLEMTGGK